MKVICWQCTTPFEPSKESVTAWVESNQPFDPTDWKCPSCEQRPTMLAPDVGQAAGVEDNMAIAPRQ
jgi:hypothetical protein